MIEFKDRMNFAACVRMVCDIFGIEYYHDYAELLYAQSRLETGKHTSNIYKNGNNLFGMKASKKRGRYWKDVLNGHARYQHKFISIMDRIDWDLWHGNKYHFIKHPDKYMENVVNQGYAEDKDYLIKWKKLYND